MSLRRRARAAVAAARAACVDSSWQRVAVWAAIAVTFLVLSVHASTRDGATALRPAAFFVLALFVVGGFRWRNSFATAVGLTGLGLVWALSQTVESATAAVLVGAVVTLMAVALSWLTDPPIRSVPAAHARRTGRLIVVSCGAILMGLLALRSVDRPPADRMVLLLGVVAVIGILGLFFVLGEPDEPDPVTNRHSVKDIIRGDEPVHSGRRSQISGLPGRGRTIAGRGAGAFGRRT